MVTVPRCALLNDQFALVQKYLYDAYGNMLPGADLTVDPATALTSFLYSGEQVDAATGLGYNRRRYLAFDIGRLLTFDPYRSNIQDPLSLHKQLYANGNPIMGTDPSGLITSLFGTADWGRSVHTKILEIYRNDHAGADTSRSGRWTKIGPAPGLFAILPLYRAKVDILNTSAERYAEIKPLSFSGIAAGLAQMKLRRNQFLGTGFKPDVSWTPSTHVGFADGEKFVFVNVAGLVLYSDRDDLLEDILAIGSAQAARLFLQTFGVDAVAALATRARALATIRLSVDSSRGQGQMSIGLLIAAGFGVPL